LTKRLVLTTAAVLYLVVDWLAALVLLFAAGTFQFLSNHGRRRWRQQA
jgi:hypothetical protein